MAVLTSGSQQLARWPATPSGGLTSGSRRTDGAQWMAVLTSGCQQSIHWPGGAAAAPPARPITRRPIGNRVDLRESAVYRRGQVVAVLTSGSQQLSAVRPPSGRVDLRESARRRGTGGGWVDLRESAAHPLAGARTPFGSGVDLRESAVSRWGSVGSCVGSLPTGRPPRRGVLTSGSQHTGGARWRAVLTSGSQRSIHWPGGVPRTPLRLRR